VVHVGPSVLLKLFLIDSLLPQLVLLKSSSPQKTWSNAITATTVAMVVTSEMLGNTSRPMELSQMLACHTLLETVLLVHAQQPRHAKMDQPTKNIDVLLEQDSTLLPQMKLRLLFFKPDP
jgi:hypothetical protein